MEEGVEAEKLSPLEGPFPVRLEMSERRWAFSPIEVGFILPTLRLCNGNARAWVRRSSGSSPQIELLRYFVRLLRIEDGTAAARPFPPTVTLYNAASSDLLLDYAVHFETAVELNMNWTFIMEVIPKCHLSRSAKYPRSPVSAFSFFFFSTS